MGSQRQRVATQAKNSHTYCIQSEKLVMSYNMFIRIFFGTLLQLEVHIAITESSTIISEDTHTSH